MMRRTYTISLVLGAGLLALLFMRDDHGGTTATMRPDAEPTLTATEAPSSAGSTGGTTADHDRPAIDALGTLSVLVVDTAGNPIADAEAIIDGRKRPLS